AGTGTYNSKPAGGVYTNWNSGPYIFRAADSGRTLARDGAPTKPFEPSLFVWATVMSRPTENRAIVDAGLKALAFDSGPPLVCDEPDVTYELASDELGHLAVAAAANRFPLFAGLWPTSPGWTLFSLQRFRALGPLPDRDDGAA